MRIRNLAHHIFLFLASHVTLFMSHPENELKELQKLEKRINSRRPSNERLQLGERLFQQEEPGPQPIYLR
jgi:hypothetical protein